MLSALSYPDRCKNPKIMGFLGFCLALIECLRIVGFLTVQVNYGVIVVMFLLPLIVSICTCSTRVNLPMLALVAYIPLNIIIAQPHPIFNSWSRYGLFLVVLSSASPLFENSSLRHFRIKCLNTFLVAIFILCCISFVCYFIGVNFFSSQYGPIDYRTQAGGFSALFKHSMVLGPMSAISTCFSFWIFLRTKRKVFLILAIACLGATMFSASRSATVGGALSCIAMLYFNKRSKSSFIKAIFIIGTIGALSFPLWQDALQGIEKKNEINRELGEYGSRTDKYAARFAEIESHPVFGVGFAAVDPNGDDYYDRHTGVIEPGSSWLGIISMTGIVGLLLVLFVFIKSFKSLIRSRHPVSVLLIGLLIFFVLHMIFEGYVFAGGSVLCFLLWLVVGIAQDIHYAK